MKELVNLLVIVLLSITYLVVYSKIQLVFFNRKFGIRTNAITILYISSILSAGIILIDISKVISDAYNFFYAQSMAKTFQFTVLFFIGAFIFAWLLFYISFSLTSLLTKEDEKTQLIANNIELSLLHSIILVLLALIIAPSLLHYFATFIPYPERPF
ncbi:MAG: hypothetical protein ACKO7P_01435 [Bacteroidota bacterium]